MELRDPISSASHLLTALWAAYATLILIRLSPPLAGRKIAVAVFGLSMVLLYLASGLADVYEIQNGDGIALTPLGTTGTQNLNTPASERSKLVYGDPVAFTATTTIDRKDFGLTWNQALETGGVLVGDKVEIEAEIQAVKQVEAQVA